MTYKQTEKEEDDVLQNELTDVELVSGEVVGRKYWILRTSVQKEWISTESEPLNLRAMR